MSLSPSGSRVRGFESRFVADWFSLQQFQAVCSDGDVQSCLTHGAGNERCHLGCDHGGGDVLQS